MGRVRSDCATLAPLCNVNLTTTNNKTSLGGYLPFTAACIATAGRSMLMMGKYSLDLLPEYIRSRVVVNEASGCWEWTRALSNGYGTGQIDGVQVLIHRAAYKALVGQIPNGLCLDHLCRNRKCCNPEHLDPCSRGENTLRGNTITAANAAKTHCKMGHPLSGDNLSSYVGSRICLACRRNYMAERIKTRRDSVNARRRELRAIRNNKPYLNQ